MSVSIQVGLEGPIRQCTRKKRLTKVLTHTPLSTSQVRTVESKPQLYALPFPGNPVANSAFDTRAVCDFSTAIGAFRFIFKWAVLRRFFLSSPRSGVTWWSSGIEVFQTPMRPSHEEVRRYEPDTSADMQDNGPVCRCREATVDALGPSAARETRVRHAVRSCDELARMRDLVSDDGNGTTQTEVIGAWCTEMSVVGFWE
jgi:hypothetical protein